LRYKLYFPCRAVNPARVRNIVLCLMRVLTRQGHLVEDQGKTYLGDIDPNRPERPLSGTPTVSCGSVAADQHLSFQHFGIRKYFAPHHAMCVSITKHGYPSVSATPRAAITPGAALPKFPCLARAPGPRFGGGAHPAGARLHPQPSPKS